MEIDVRGLNCPVPVVRTKNALEGLAEGELTVLVDRAEASQNVQRFAASQGCRVEVEERDGLFSIHIHKEKPGERATEAAAPPAGRDVVLITTDCLGTGDRQLGGILMKAFLNTLWDAAPKPEKIIFLNDGVRLTTGDSEVLEALRLLEGDGVRIFSCGTCLEYYGLKEQLAVGAVTNMYDTVASLLAAGKVIKI